MKKRNIGKKNVNGNFIYDNFLLGLRYMKKIKIFFFIAVILILLTFAVGYFGLVGLFSTSLSKNIDDYVTQSVAEIIEQTENLSSIELTLFIIDNNIKTAFFGIVSGIYLAVSPIIVVIFNGYILGFVAERAVNSPTNSEGIFVLWRLFPHGIFELPAILISIGLGIKLGLYPFYLREKGKGFLSLLVSFITFFILSGIILAIISLFVNPDLLSPQNLASDSELFNNPLISILFYSLIALSFIISFIIGFKVLLNRDKAVVFDLIKNSIRVFIFIIVPLLVIAGLIEGLLIYLVG